LLALVHARDDVEFGDAAVRDLGADERVGDDPDHFAAGLQCAVGDRAHQPEPAPAIDDTDTACRKRAADVARGFDIDRIFGRRGPAIDGKAFHISSNINWAVALALPTTPGIPAPGCVPAPTK